MRIPAASIAVALLIPAAARADPDCAGPDRWPAAMTFAALKNDGVLTSDGVDFARTTSTLIASQRIGKDRFRQVFLVTFHPKTGDPVTAITVSDASSDECSMAQPTIYRVTPPASK